MPAKTLKLLYFSFIYPTLLYGIEIYANKYLSYLHDLMVLNNRILRILQIKSNQMSLPNVRFAVKTTSVTLPSITGRYQCTTQADRDVGYREWFKIVQ